MKLQFSNQKNRAWSSFELLVVVMLALLILCLLFALLMPARVAQHRRTRNLSSASQRINCVSNLKQIGLAMRVWAGDNNNQYPMQVSVANHGAMELINSGNVAGCFAVMAPELSTPKILVCPADADCVPAKHFSTRFNNSNVSYFLEPDANQMYPQMVLSGDDNLAVDGTAVKAGILELSTNDTISWTAGRHPNGGNIGFADGSVMETSSLGLQRAFQFSALGTPATTNRVVVP